MKLNIIWLLFFVGIFSLNFVSSSSIIGQIPDVTLPYNSSIYKIWLWDYYNIDTQQNYYDPDPEPIRIRFEDPLNQQLLNLYANYYFLNPDGCFEISYGFESRGGGYYEDVINIWTYDSNCDVSIEVDFINHPQLNQVFNLFVRSQSSTSTVVNNTYYNFSNSSNSLFSSLLSYYPFDQNTFDFKNHSDLKTSGTIYYGTGFKGSSLRVGNAEGSVFLNNSLIGFSNSASLSYWYKVGNECNGFVGAPGNNDYLVYPLDSYNRYLSIFEYNNDISKLYGYSSGNDYALISPFQYDVWHNVVYVFNSSIFFKIYYDGVLNLTGASSSQFNLDGTRLGLSQAGEQCNFSFIDEVLVFNKSLNSSDVAKIYNGGLGMVINQTASPYAPSSSVIPDIYLNQSQLFNISFNSYFTGWRSVYLRVKSPYGSYFLDIYPGSYSGGNGDYFDINNLASYMTIQTYNRSYNFNITIFACNTTYYTDCSNRTFLAAIGGNESLPIQVNQFEYIYDLGRDVNYQKIFSGNYFFQYYDTIVFSFPESNFTGVLGNGTEECPNCRGNWNYTDIENPVLNASYMVFLSCDITGDEYTYNYLGDLNITVECGNGQSYFTLSPFNDYGQEVYFTAINSRGSISDYTQLIVGNPSYPSGYVPQIENSTTDIIDENVNVFGSVLPQNVSSKAQHKIVFLVLFIVNGLIILSLVSYGRICFYTCLVITTLLLFVFASVDYISLAYPVLILFLSVVLLIWGAVRQ